MSKAFKKFVDDCSLAGDCLLFGEENPCEGTYVYDGDKGVLAKYRGGGFAFTCARWGAIKRIEDKLRSDAL